MEPTTMAPLVGQQAPLVKRWVKVRLPCLLSVVQAVQRTSIPCKHAASCPWALFKSCPL